MKVQLYITRWTDRPPTEPYKKMLKHLQSPPEPDLDVFIPFHGIAAPDKGTTEYENSYFVNGRTQIKTTIIDCIERAIAAKATWVGFLDDDAFLPLQYFMVNMHEVDEVHAMVAGPIDGYSRWIMKYEQSKDNLYYMGERHLSTLGCQVYRVSFLKKTRHLWEPALLGCDFLPDVMFHLAAIVYGYDRVAFTISAFKHDRSQATTTESIGYEWYVRRMKKTFNDHNAIRKAFKDNCTSSQWVYILPYLDIALAQEARANRNFVFKWWKPRGGYTGPPIPKNMPEAHQLWVSLRLPSLIG